MTMDLQKARDLLRQGGYTCVLCRGGKTVTHHKRGVAPLLEMLDSGESFENFCAADKVVGKAAAMLYVLLGVSAVWAEIISAPAEQVLLNSAIPVFYDRKVSAIRNRTDTGNCPMETAVWEISDCRAGEKAIRLALEKLTGK